MKKSREILNNLGESESEEKIRQYEEDARLKKVKRFQENNPEFMDFLGEVDFKLLADIIRKIAEKSNIDPKTVNIVGPDRISYSRAIEYDLAAYHPIENIIYLNLDFPQLREIMPKLVNAGIDLKVEVLSSLIHEEVHASARVVCMGLEEKSETRVGYSPEYQRGRERKQLFRLFNEGVTQKLGLEIFNEYVHAKNLLKREELGRFNRFHQENDPTITFVNTLIERLSYETGVSKEAAWHSMIRGAYEGENLQDPELERLFEELLSRDIIGEITTANIEDLKRLTKILQLPEKKE